MLGHRERFGHKALLDKQKSSQCIVHPKKVQFIEHLALSLLSRILQLSFF